MRNRQKQDWSPRDRKRPDSLNISPDWKFIANLGDRHPLDYGGYFIYEDKNDFYGNEADYIVPDDNGKKFEVFRIYLERYTLVDGYLVPLTYDSTWPRPLAAYDAWFHRHLADAASSSGVPLVELEAEFTSPNPLVRAQGARTLGDYLGWDNFGQPSTYTLAQMKRKYRKELLEISEGS